MTRADWALRLLRNDPAVPLVMQVLTVTGRVCLARSCAALHEGVVAQRCMHWLSEYG